MVTCDEDGPLGYYHVDIAVSRLQRSRVFYIYIKPVWKTCVVDEHFTVVDNNAFTRKSYHALHDIFITHTRLVLRILENDNLSAVRDVLVAAQMSPGNRDAIDDETVASMQGVFHARPIDIETTENEQIYEPRTYENSGDKKNNAEDVFHLLVGLGSDFHGSFSSIHHLRRFGTNTLLLSKDFPLSYCIINRRMDKKQKLQGLDGFTLQRRTPSAQPLGKSGVERPAIPQQFLRPQIERTTAVSSAAPEVLPKPEAVKSGGLRRAEIDESLNALDEQEPEKKKRFRKKHSRRKWIFLAIALLILGALGYFAFKFIFATGRVFSGNVLDLLASNVELKEDENGRTNILIFGTSEDDPNHGGAALTDSIMVLSIDQDKHDAGMVSMPRDMWVNYDMSPCCGVGCAGKINALYYCADGVDDIPKGSAALQAKVGEIFGLDIQYYVKVNYTALRQAVDAVGGVTVTIESDDSRGIYDYNTKVKLPNGPATLNGEQALALARARGDGGGYGFTGSNFVREQYQQKILVALRDKALSSGTLANPIAISNLIDALGDNVRTNFSTAEVKTLASVGQKVSANSIVHISLVDKDTPVVTTGTYNGQSIVQPKAGIGEYDEIKSYIKKYMLGGELVAEDATIEVLNASTQVGIAAKKADALTAAGLINVTTNDTTFSSSKAITWYDTTGGKKPKTQAKIASVLGSQPTGTTLPSGVQSNADFVIVLGDQ